MFNALRIYSHEHCYLKMTGEMGSTFTGLTKAREHHDSCNILLSQTHRAQPHTPIPVHWFQTELPAWERGCSCGCACFSWARAGKRKWAPRR